MTQKQFASFTGISEASLSGVLHGKTKPTLNMVMAIKNSLPKISLDWLIDGTGSMYASKDENTQGAPTDNQSGQSGAPQSPMLDFSSPLPSEEAARTVQQTVRQEPKIEKTEIKYVDKPAKRITHITVFYDDQTWESFVPQEPKSSKR